MEAVVTLGLYLIRDSKAAAFLSQPIVAPTPGMAERQFLDLLRDQPYFSKHAGDFSLWEVGALDDVSGQLEPCSVRECVNGPQVLALIKEA